MDKLPGFFFAQRSKKVENGDAVASGDIAGYYDPKTTKKQELILIHELDHSVRKFVDLGGNVHTLVYEGAEKGLSKETWEQIQAYYTEAILGGKVTVDMLLGYTSSAANAAPSPQGEGLAKKILNFFTSAARARR